MRDEKANNFQFIMFKKNTTKLNLNNKNKSKTINNIIIINKNHFFYGYFNSTQGCHWI